MRSFSTVQKSLSALGVSAFVLLAQALPSHGEEPIKIYTYLLADRLNVQQTLSYNKVLHHITQGLDKDSVEFVPAPIRRSQRSFKTNERSCVFPTTVEALKLVHKADLGHRTLVQSDPFDYTSIRLFTSLDHPKITNLDQLKGKTVGHLLGSVGKRMLKGVDTITQSATDEGRLVRLLAHGRIDVLMGHYPDTAMAIDRLGAKPLHYHDDMTIYHTEARIVCHNFSDANSLISQVNPQIKRIRQNGKMQEWLGHHAQIALTQFEGQKGY